MIQRPSKSPTVTLFVSDINRQIVRALDIFIINGTKIMGQREYAISMQAAYSGQIIRGIISTQIILLPKYCAYGRKVGVLEDF